MSISELAKLRCLNETLCNVIKTISSTYQLVIFLSSTFFNFEATFSLYTTLIVFISTVRKWSPQQIFIAFGVKYVLGSLGGL